MTFKIKNGLQVGSTTVVDQNSYFQQTESAAAIAPSLSFDFTTKTLDSRLSFSRASTATYIGSDGFVKTVAAGIPRFTHDPINKTCKGYLSENTRTNLRPYSSYFGNYSGNASYYLGNATSGMDSSVLGPDGLTRSCKITAGSAGTFARIGCPVTVATVPAYYTYSVFVKAGTANFVHGTFEIAGTVTIRYYGNLTTGVSQTGTPSNGTISATTNMTQYPNGWWRFEIAISTTTSTGTYDAYIGPSNAYTSVNSSLGDSIYVWGEQVEQGNFVTSYIPSTQTFTSRASSGTYFDNGGVLRSATTNAERLSYNPSNLNLGPAKLYETAATNLLWWSEDFANTTAWTPGPATPTITGNQTVSPDGNATADLFTRATNSFSNFVSQNYTKSATATKYTFSLFVKKSVGNYCSLRTQGTYPSRADVIFDISVGGSTSGTIVSAGAVATSTFTTASATITYINNGWYRISLTATSDTATNYTCVVSFSSQIAVVDGADSASNSAGYMWGAQLETGDVATSYISTVGATATRSADVFTAPTTTRSNDDLLIQNPLLSKYWNQREGTMAVQFYSAQSFISQDNYPSVLFAGGSSGNLITLYGNGNGSGSGTTKITNYGMGINSVTLNDYVDFTVVKGLNKAAMAFAANSSILYGNGAGTVEDTTIIVPLITFLRIGGTGASSNWNEAIASFAYYPKRLDNNTLLNLTT